MIPWSYSKLSLYEKCPAQAKYRYVERRPSPKHPAAQRGTDAHQTMEDFLLGKSKILHEVVEPFRHVLKAVKRKDPFVEFKIAVNRNWQLVPWDVSYGRSVIDSAYIEGNRVEIQEWKTGKMYDDHAEQRKLYLVFAGIQWPAAHDYHIQSYYFDLGKKKGLEMTKEELKDVRADFSARIQIMEGDDIMSPRPGHYCGWCAFSRYKGGPCKKG